MIVINITPFQQYHFVPIFRGAATRNIFNYLTSSRVNEEQQLPVEFVYIGLILLCLSAYTTSAKCVLSDGVYDRVVPYVNPAQSGAQCKHSAYKRIGRCKHKHTHTDERSDIAPREIQANIFSIIGRKFRGVARARGKKNTDALGV
uniref:Uncharacterized protein n=1 Tax=Trichogramma kaykai TaxID=54128 RepID=A0ABD2X634_9HYME